MRSELHINIDHIATLRNARQTIEPDLIESLKVIEGTKARGITTHLREDRRHINDRDISQINEYLQGSRLSWTFEMGASKEIQDIALKTKARLITLVPERRDELTTEGGLDVAANKNFLAEFIQAFHDKGIKVSMFIDPVFEQVEASREIGADCIELHTGTYANLFIKYQQQQAMLGSLYNPSLASKFDYQDLTDPLKQEIDRIARTVEHAQKLRLQTNLGHGLTVPNLPPLLENLTEIRELHIGHSIIANSLYYGLLETINLFYAQIPERKVVFVD